MYGLFWNIIRITFLLKKAKLRKIVEDTSQITRIYIFYGGMIDLLRFMSVMRKKDLFNSHEYTIIYVEKEKQKSKRNFYQYLWNNLQGEAFGVSGNWDCRQLYSETYPYAGWNSLIVIAPSP